MKILAIGVHPDDIELSCSGTLFKHLDLGHEIALCDLTRGELGTRGTPETRKEEAESARKLFGDVNRVNLGLPDGFVYKEKNALLRLIEVIRKEKPQVVLANAEHDRHPDHGRAADFVEEACFLAGLIKIETDWNGRAQEAWRPKIVWHYIQDRYIVPDIVIDITDCMDRKMETILAYRTQFYQGDEQGPQTPISSREFLEAIKGRAREFGRVIGAEFGEGFTCRRPIELSNLGFAN